jgi:hypothetical protein
MNVSLAAAVRGDLVRGCYLGGWFGLASIGRLPVTRAALAMQAAAFVLLIGLTDVAVRARAGR